MKKKTLLPQLTAPVIRTNNTSSASDRSFFGVAAQTYCDIATRQCNPFAGDDAE
ncbi:hypothetical protein NIES2100_10940 [Calothrix sp. NIES-2100]|uniref:anacyclamide/piricyclamide family prenylated cyclic peptide n=1 Tax=Calothrix sp. NIES-2100 TaxID=1954172 RepID=UPI000B5E1D73|nr:hypothetical protein NIES2100_10940 [Calothrix sp. NIES-2100]